MRWFALISSLLFLTSCAAGPSNFVGLELVEPTLAASEGATIQNLFVATSRKRSDNQSEFYSGARAQNLNLGNVDVTIPPIHKLGKVEKPRKGEREDLAKHFTIARPLVFENNAAFLGKLNQALRKQPAKNRTILVFVHGYNTNFSSAVLRMAQFVNDTGFKGVPVLFTWSSRGRTVDYVYDINSALQARYYLVELAKILSQSEADNFSIVAHSMGNLTTLEAMTILAKQDFKPKADVNRVILAAPDVDLDLFNKYVRDLAPVKDKVVVLISEDDQALILSRRIAGGIDRVGATNPQNIADLGINVIDLAQINDRSNANHSKFADSPDIVQLVGLGIASGNTLSTTSADGLENSFGSVFSGVSEIAAGVGGVLTLGN